MARRKPEKQTEISKERIRLLLGKAREADGPMANRYASLAKKMAMRFNTRLERSQKRQICPRCKAYLSPGARTVRTSAARQAVVATCKACGHSVRLPYAKEKAAAKRKRMGNRKPKL